MRLSQGDSFRRRAGMLVFLTLRSNAYSQQRCVSHETICSSGENISWLLDLSPKIGYNLGEERKGGRK